MIGKTLGDRHADRFPGQRRAAAAQAVAALLSWALALCLAPRGGAAAEELARDPARFKGWEVQGVDVRGLREGDLADQIKRGIYLTGEKMLVFTDFPEFYPQALEDDLQRIRLFLARNGYPYAQVEAGFEPNPEAEKVKVVFEIEPGPAVTVGQTGLQGLAEVQVEDLELPLRPGERFSEPDLQRSLDQIVDGMRRSGHARAAAEPTVTPLDSTSVRVDFQALPGAIYTWSGASVEGASEDLAPLAIKKMNVPVGKTFDPEAIERARDNLRQLGLFSAIRLSLDYPDSQRVSLHASLEQRQPRSIEGSVGYWTDEQVVLRGRWIHRNLLSEGRGVMLYATYSRFRREGGVSFWWPAMLGGATRGEAIASIEQQDEEGFIVTTTGLQTTLRWDYGYRKRVRIGAAFQDVTVEVEPTVQDVFEEEGGLLTYLLLGWNLDTTDDRLYPTDGALGVADLEFAPPGFFSDSHYWRLESALALYEGLGGGAVLAGQVAAGLAGPLGASLDLLPHKRFYAGGASSMRGFKRRELGPMDEEGIPLGGEASLLGTLELRFPVSHPVMGALFVDVGQVWGTRSEVDLGSLAVAVGPGIRFATPVGPVRADFGYRLTSVEPERARTVFHLGIGHPF